MQSIKIQISDEQQRTVEQAAKLRHMSRSAFVNESVLRAACDLLSDRTLFQLSREEFDVFEQFLENPPPNRAPYRSAQAETSLRSRLKYLNNASQKFMTISWSQ
jgi:uncharacterized protein (DUF1778 family)